MGNDVAVTPEARKRADIYRDMSDKLKKQADWFSMADKKFAEGILIQAWNRGDRIRQIIEDEASYGNNAVEELADFRSVSNSSLYALRNFSVGYGKDEIKALAVRQMSNGQHIDVKHCQIVLRVAASEDKRAVIFDRVFENSMTANQLEDELATAADKNDNRGGRKPSKPASVTGGIKGTDRVLTSLLNRCEIMEEDVYGKIEEMEPDRVNDVLLESLDAQLELLDDAAKGVAGMQKQAKAARTRVERVLSKRPKEPVAVAPAKKATKKAAKKKVAKVVKKSGEKPKSKKSAKKGGKVVKGAKPGKTDASKGAKKKSSKSKK